MTQFATRMAAIAPSPTLALTAKAQALAAQGIPVINFGIGEPDFNTPEHIRQACHDALEKGATKYGPVPGIPALREAIAKHVSTASGLSFAAKDIIVTSGAKEALYALMQILVNPGDEVVIPAPYWVSYSDQVMMCEGVPVIVAAGAESGFKITPAQLRTALTPKTKCVMFNSPSNPSGAVYSRAELTALLNVLADHTCWIISDEIYDELVYTPGLFCSALQAAPHLRSRIIVVNGLSKTFAMTGWRLGWVAADAAVVSQLGTWQGQVTSHATSFAQHGAVVAYTGTKEPVAQMRTAFHKRRDVMVRLLNDVPGVKCLVPDGAFYAFPDVRGVLGKRADITTSVALSEYLLDKAQIACVPGEAFGLPGYLRLSYALGEADITAGIQRMRAALAAV